MTIIWSGNRKPRYALFKRTLLIHLSDIQIIIVLCRPLVSSMFFQADSGARLKRESGETMHKRKSKYCCVRDC